MSNELPPDTVFNAVRMLTRRGSKKHRIKISVEAELDEGQGRGCSDSTDTFVVGKDGPLLSEAYLKSSQQYAADPAPEQADPDNSTARCANRKCLDKVDFDALPEVDFSNTQKEALLETARKAEVEGAPSLKDKFTQYLMDAFGAIDFDALGHVNYSNTQKDAFLIEARAGGGGGAH